jgi:hypothetical protein
MLKPHAKVKLVPGHTVARNPVSGKLSTFYLTKNLTKYKQLRKNRNNIRRKMPKIIFNGIVQRKLT